MADAKKLYELALRMSATIAPSMAKSFDKAQTLVEKYGKTADALKGKQRELDSVMAQRRTTLEAAQAFAQATARVKELAAQMAASEKPSRDLTREYERAQAAVKKAAVTLETEKQKLREVDAASGMTAKGIGEISAAQKKLAGDVEKANRAFERQKKVQKLADFGAGLQNAGIEKYIRGMMTFNTVRSAATTALGGPVKLGMEFDATMSKVGAVSGAVGKDFERLREQAELLGATTEWSASDAAEGMTYLAMAGFKVEDMIKTMPGMLSLATAGGLDLASAADIASNMLSGFGLQASEMGRVGDVLVNTFTASNTDLHGLGETMKYVAPVAASLGVSFETAAAMAGKLGDVGIQGSQAGTALRAILSRLAAPASAGAKALYALGVEIKDAEGNMRSMPAILADLQNSMEKSGLSQVARTAIVSDIFGQESMAAALTLMEQASSGTLQGFIESLGKTGSAAEVAAKQNDNLAGDLKNLSSVWESTELAISKAVTPSLRKLTKFLTKTVAKVADFLERNKTLTTILFYVGSAIAAIMATFGALMVTMGSAIYVFGTAIKVAALLSKGFLGLTTLIGLMGKAFTVAKAAAGALSGALGLLPKVFALVKAGALAMNAVLIANPIGLVITVITALIAAGWLLYENWDYVKQKGAELWAWFSETFPNLAAIVSGASESFIGKIKDMWENVKAIFGGIIDFVSHVFAGEWGAAVESLGGVVQGVFGLLFDLMSMPFTGFIAFLKNQFPEAATAIEETVENIKGKFNAFIEFITGDFASAWSSAWTAVTSIFSKIWDGITGKAKSALTWAETKVSEIGGKIADFFNFGGDKLTVAGEKTEALTNTNAAPTFEHAASAESSFRELAAIPAMAAGGVVTGPTTALIGEGGEPEAVIPLSKLGDMLESGTVNNNYSSSQSRESVTLNYSPTINVTAPSGSGTDGNLEGIIRMAVERGHADLKREIERFFKERSRLGYG